MRLIRPRCNQETGVAEPIRLGGVVHMNISVSSRLERCGEDVNTKMRE